MIVSVIIPVYNQENLVIRAIESIPKRNDIEIIVIDDGSTDDTFIKLINYRNNSKQNIILLYNEKNKGVASAVNKGYDNAIGEYIVLLGSDDYFYTDKFEECLKELDGTDLIYFDLQINNGDIFHLCEETKEKYCGSTKFIKNDFIGFTRCPENVKAAEDYYFYQDLLKKNPSEKFTNKVIKHYNFPRENSLTDLNIRRMLK